MWEPKISDCEVRFFNDKNLKDLENKINAEIKIWKEKEFNFAIQTILKFDDEFIAVTTFRQAKTYIPANYSGKKVSLKIRHMENPQTAESEN